LELYNKSKRQRLDFIASLTKPAGNIGFAARLAGHWSNGHFIVVVLHLGWTNIVGLLFVNLYFYIFNQ
jgi:hypothetical protein